MTVVMLGKRQEVFLFFLEKSDFTNTQPALVFLVFLGEVPKLVINTRIFFANQFLILSN